MNLAKTLRGLRQRSRSNHLARTAQPSVNARDEMLLAAHRAGVPVRMI